jgi:hypothetical protein
VLYGAETNFHPERKPRCSSAACQPKVKRQALVAIRESRGKGLRKTRGLHDAAHPLFYWVDGSAPRVCCALESKVGAISAI